MLWFWRNFRHYIPKPPQWKLLVQIVKKIVKMTKFKATGNGTSKQLNVFQLVKANVQLSILWNIWCLNISYLPVQLVWSANGIYFSLKLIGAQWRHMALKILVNNGSGNDLLPNGTKPLPEPMLTYHQLGSVAFIWGHYHKKIWR